MVWGTDAQKERLLNPILTADEIWCQGFSEPEAGSDLAALKTRAVKDGDEWVVTGQKVWTSGAQYSKWCMLVARTDSEVPKHKGLTYFALDMEQEGVQVRPLRQITGSAEFNELFIEEARIPDDMVIGGVGNGWKVALTTLMNERAGLAFFLQVRMRNLLDRLIEEAAERGLLDDDVVADKLGDLHVKCEILRLTAYRGLTATEKYGQPGPGGLGDQVDVVGHEPAARAGRRRPARAGGAHRRHPVVLRAAARARQLDRGRHHGDPQEHRRRAGPGPAARCAREHGMHFDFTEDQQEIKRTAREVLASRSSFEAVRRAAESGAYDDALWRELSELGWPGIAVAEEHGGQGLGGVELAILLEELGYAVAATPFLATTLAAAALQEAGSDEQRARWLPALASGEATGALGAAARRGRRARARRRCRGGHRPALGRRCARASRGRTRTSRRSRASTRRGGSRACAATAASRWPATPGRRSTGRPSRWRPSSSACASAAWT